MYKLKEEIINHIIDIEGGYVNDPSDSGGESMYGITESVARRYGYTYKMEKLPRSLAFEIYSKRYWDALSLDDVEKLSPMITKELADTGINQGVGRAGEFLQRSLNVLNNNGKFYNDIKVDGAVGGKTIHALKTYFGVRSNDGEGVLFNMLNCLQGAFYITLAERRTKDEKFVFGWFKNRVE